jgi:hypothetical protein
VCDALLREAHPPSIEHEIILFLFVWIHTLCMHCNNWAETVKAGKIVENYRSSRSSVCNLLRSRWRLRQCTVKSARR